MTDYNSLSYDDKKTLDDFMEILRPSAGEIARVCNKIQIMISLYNTSVSSIVTSLSSNSEIPNVTGLAGAQKVTKEDIVTFMQAIGQVNVGYDTTANRGQWIQLAGAKNTLG